MQMIGTRIKKIRQERRMSQTALAAAAFPGRGLVGGQKKISRIEACRQDPKSAELLCLARALEIPAAELVKGE